MRIWKSNFVLVIFSVLIALFFLEIYFSLTISKPYKHEYFFKRYYLYNEGNVFKNVNNFFKFFPNNSIRQDAYYFVDDDFTLDPFTERFDNSVSGFVFNLPIIIEQPYDSCFIPQPTTSIIK